jgi:predicted transcriptional regulator
MKLQSDEVLDFLITHGPAKATVIAHGCNASETTMRKLLKQLLEEGVIKKDGQMFVYKANKKQRSQRSVTRELVQERDDVVLGILKKLNGDETMSRTEILKAVKSNGWECTGSHVYLSLHRLRAEGLVQSIRIGKRAPEWCVK